MQTESKYKQTIFCSTINVSLQYFKYIFTSICAKMTTVQLLSKWLKTAPNSVQKSSTKKHQDTWTAQRHH